jgi:hypothetical protein
MTQENNGQMKSGGGVNAGVVLRNILLVVLIAFFALGSVAAYAVIAGANRVDQSVVQPVSDLVRSLIVPATPVYIPNPTTIVLQINNLSRLETASIELEKVITAERNQEALWGLLGESMVFVANGKVIAGVDLSKMTVDDIQVYGPDTVMIHLPPAETFDDLPALNTEKSYVAHRGTGLLTRADASLETEVRQLAETTIREAAKESGVVLQAEENAENYLRDFLQSLGFTNVTFTDSPPPPPAVPFVQEVPKGYILVTPTPEG